MIKEEEIRPKTIFDEYLRLTGLDVKIYFDVCPRVEITCPACKETGEFSFHKQGFDYDECPKCRTLFVNPRPIAEAFNRYYQESESSKFWATTFYKATAEARREKLWKPKALLVRDQLRRYAPEDAAVVDIGGGYGIFAEEIRSLDIPVVVVEPAPHLADICRGKGLDVVEQFLENVKDADLPTGTKAFTSFELFEHLHDPQKFLTHLRDLMAPGDLFIFTTLSGTGVDIRVLWEDSKSVSPPHHLNFMNPSSASLLLERCGFSPLEVTTPGQLDIDIMYNNRNQIKDKFWNVFFEQADDVTRMTMQKAISATGFSSHMMIVSRAI